MTLYSLFRQNLSFLKIPGLASGHGVINLMLHCLSEQTLETAPATNPHVCNQLIHLQYLVRMWRALKLAHHERFLQLFDQLILLVFLMRLQLPHLEDIIAWFDVLLRTQQTLRIVLSVFAIFFCKHYLFHLGDSLVILLFLLHSFVQFH